MPKHRIAPCMIVSTLATFIFGVAFEQVVGGRELLESTGRRDLAVANSFDRRWAHASAAGDRGAGSDDGVGDRGAGAGWAIERRVVAYSGRRARGQAHIHASLVAAGRVRRDGAYAGAGLLRALRSNARRAAPRGREGSDRARVALREGVPCRGDPARTSGTRRSRMLHFRRARHRCARLRRGFDGCHFSAEGLDRAADLWVEAIASAKLDPIKP